MRELKGWLKWVVSFCLVAVAVFHLYTAIFGVFQPEFNGYSLDVLFPMAFILFPASKTKSPTDRPSFWMLYGHLQFPAVVSHADGCETEPAV